MGEGFRGPEVQGRLQGGVVALWTEVFRYEEPHNDPLVSIELKMARDPDLFLVAVDDDKVIGMVMGGYDGHREVDIFDGGLSRESVTVESDRC